MTERLVVIDGDLTTRGTPRQRRRPMKEGDIFQTKSFGDVVVKKLLGGERVLVEFEDGTSADFFKCAVARGFIKNYMQPVVHGVGYLGTPKASKCRAYGIWTQMLERCYTDKFPAYSGCSVVREWHNFSNFKSWYEEQDGCEDSDYQLDKDILAKGNKIYGPENCILVPSKLNKLLENSKSSRGELPLGVSVHKGTQKYTARCCDAEGGYVHIGLYSTANDAFLAYKQFKESVIKRAALKYQNVLPETAFNSLMVWEVNKDD